VTGESQSFEGGSHLFGRQRRNSATHKLTHISVIWTLSGIISPSRSFLTSR
jgi:hypothetical protein